MKKEDWARLDYFDQWFPDLAPDAALVKWYHEEHPISEARWRKYIPRYRRQMARPEKQRLIELLARLSHDSNFSIGCYCEDGTRCHRSLLGEMLKAKGARVVES